ncbi:hypothetical protein E6C70_11120 [Glaciibacter flavus]|uniref:DUF4190 domain-containing protein n=1 Tax=Orlajensenia flava TaxID=2565934 RepID=A0A4S4FT67_9MICO|nr:hypothetical protein [Glaciibacter flavus]THG33970.1 hypothetical protein E6C70_11120 [Glaciibacter flavus]
MTETTPTTTKKTLAVVSIILGAVSILLCWILPILWVVVAIVGVVLGFLSRSREPQARRLALVGIILSFIGIALNIGSMILGAILVAQYMQR